MSIRWCGLVLLFVAGCGPSGFGPPDRPEYPDEMPAQAAKPNGGVPGNTPTVNVPVPAPAAVKWKPGDPGVKELNWLSNEINFEPNITFDELSSRFAKARAEKKVLPNGQCELDQLYKAAIRASFRGKWDHKSRIEFLREWREAKPEDPTPVILLAKTYHSWGWQARGSGVAATVNEANFKLFHERLTAGLEFAMAAEKLSPPDPEAYVVLIGIGQGLSVPRKHFDNWVEAGRKIQPNYFPLYEAAAFNLLPRWHGAPGDVERLAEDLYAKIGGDDGAEAYARCAMAVTPFDRDILYSGEFDQQKVIAGAAVMGRRYPQETSLVPFLTIMAWMDQNQPLTRKLLERYIKAGKPEHGLMSVQYDRIYNFCESEAPPDKPDAKFWPYLNPAEQLIYFNGGQGFITTPAAKFELVRIWDRNNLHGPREVIPELQEKVGALQIDTAGKRMILSYGSPERCTTVSFARGEPSEPVVLSGAGQWQGTALSPDGKLAATCRQNTITLWDPTTGKSHLDLAGQFQQPFMKFSPDGQRLLVRTRTTIELFDPTNGNLLQNYTPSAPGATLNLVESFIDANSLFGYGNTVAGPPGFVKWFPDEKKVVDFTRQGGPQYVTLQDVSRNYVLCSESTRAMLYLYRLKDGKLVRTVDGHQSRLLSAVISPNESEFATADVCGPVKFWKITP